MSGNRSERLLAIVLVLLGSRRPLTRSEIREAVGDYPKDQDQGAFERMFERDKDFLRSMGIPIESVSTTDSEGVGYRLERSEAFLAGIELEPAERFVLALASRLWDESAWGHDSLNALRKLEVAGEFTTADEIRAPVSVTVNSAVLTALLDATDSRRRVEFSYRKAGMPVAEKRSVEPWGVVATKGQWYLVGHDTDRSATRVFRLSRIQGNITPKRPLGAFDIPQDVDFQSLVKSTYPPAGLIEVTVEIDPDAAPRLRWLATRLDQDVAVLAAADPDRVLYDVLADSTRVAVLGPPDFRDRVLAGLRAIAVAEPAVVSATERDRLVALRDTATKAEVPAGAQVSRLLALVPWLLNHPSATHEQAAEHFGVSVGQLRSDLMTLDIDYWGRRIVVRDAQGINAPLRLTPAESISLLIGLQLLEQVPGVHDRAALASVRTKVSVAAGSSAALANLVSAPTLAQDPDGLVQKIDRALDESRAVRLRYWSASTNAVTDRTVDPIALVTSLGQTYLQAYCRDAQGLRVFRLDRIGRLEVLSEPLHVPADVRAISATFRPHGTPAIVEVDSDVAWWSEQVPTRAVLVRSDGSLLVALDVVSQTWLIRTMLSFGGRIRVVEPPELVQSVREAAVTAIARNATQ